MWKNNVKAKKLKITKTVEIQSMSKKFANWQSQREGETATQHEATCRIQWG